MSRGLSLLYAACAVGTGLFGTAFWIARDRGPTPEAVAKASQALRSRHESGDLILLVPFYATRAREHLGDLRPLAVRRPLEEDFEVHRRVWVFGLFGEGEALRQDFASAGLKLEQAETLDGITVDRYTVTSTARVAYRFSERLREARVHHEHDGRKEPCAQWSDTNGQGGQGYGRWTCPHDGEWFYVAPEWHRMGDHPRLCLWAHPPNSGRLVIEYPNVPLTGRLHGRAGHTLNSSVNARERVDLEVEVQGGQAERAGRQRFSFPLKEHFRPFMLTTPSTGTATIAFAVSSPDAGANHFCFDADMRSP